MTALLAKLRQDQLGKDLAKLNAAGPTPLERRALAHLHTDRQRIAFLARALRRRLAARRRRRAHTDPQDPRAATSIVKGTDPASLRKGPGIYDHTPFPGAPGTTGIAGHRTTYLAPFRHIDRLKHGDDIEVDMPYATLHTTGCSTSRS